MTGHQQNPTTGLTIKGEPAPAVNLVKLAEAVGVKRIRVEDPFDMKKFKAAVKEEIDADEPSVIIAQRPCALLKSVKYGALSESIRKDVENVVPACAWDALRFLRKTVRIR